MIKEDEDQQPVVEDLTEKNVGTESASEKNTKRTKFFQMLGAAAFKLIEKFNNTTEDFEIAEITPKNLIGSHNPLKRSPPSLIIKDDLKQIKYDDEIPMAKEDAGDSDTEIYFQDNFESEFDF